MKIDRYTKVVLTIIAVGVIGLNVHFFKDDFIKEAHAGFGDHLHTYKQIPLFEYKVKKIITDCKSIGDGMKLRCTFNSS